MLEWIDFEHPPLAPRFLIVTSDDLKSSLAPLVDYKNRQGISTLVASMTMVKGRPGVDDAERLKGLIFHAYRAYNTRYVMLAGDTKEGHIPTRHRRVSQVPGSVIDATYNPTDFYYADLLNLARPGLEMETWDANGDGRYNEQEWGTPPKSYNPDGVGALPVISVARVPAGTKEQLATYVSKIISYETKMPMGGGGSFVFLATKDYGPGAAAMAEEAAGAIFPLWLPGDTPSPRVKRYAIGYSPGDLLPAGWLVATSKQADDSVGTATWLSYLGHGSQKSWDTALTTASIWKFPRAENLTVAFSCGCETGQFSPVLPWGNESSWGYKYRALDGKYHAFSLSGDQINDAVSGAQFPAGSPLMYSFPVPAPNGYDVYDAGTLDEGRCFASAWLFAEGAGIAYFGESLVLQPDLANEFERYMLECYMSGERTLGEIWLQAQNRYREQHTSHPSGDTNFEAPRIYLSILTMFGDPTLRLPPPVSVAPSVSSSSPGSLHVFLTGADRNVYQRAFHSGRWDGWTALGAPPGGASSDPGIVALPDGSVYVFVTGRNNNFYQNTGKNSTWSGWYNHGASPGIASAPAVTAVDSNNMSLFAQDAEGRLIEKQLKNGTWGNWNARTAPGVVQGRPAATRWSDRVFVFFRGWDNQLWQLTSRDAAWEGLYSHGGQLISSPTVTSWGTGSLFIFARHADGQFKQKTLANGRWEGWWPLGWLASADPAATSWGLGSLRIFTVDEHENLRLKTLDSGRWKPEWETLFKAK